MIKTGIHNRHLFFLLVISFIFTGCHNRKLVTVKEETPKEEIKDEKVYSDLTPFKEKYAVQIGVPSTELSNGFLYQFIDGWIGVPYKWAGNDTNGVDCSGFVDQVYKNVYDTKLERSAKDIINECDEIEKEKLREGDLVFFDINGVNSHIGIYLANNKFIHASSSKGVMISDLTQDYWKKCWGRAGRVK